MQSNQMFHHTKVRLKAYLTYFTDSLLINISKLTKNVSRVAAAPSPSTMNDFLFSEDSSATSSTFGEQNKIQNREKLTLIESI